MTIEGIGPVENVPKLNKLGKNQNLSDAASNDAISISSEALQKSDSYYAFELAKHSPDIRLDRVEAAKARLEKLSENMDVLESVAEKLMQVFGV